MYNNIDVYDIETLASCFTYTGYDINNKKYNQFVLHKDKFQLKELVDHLLSLYAGIGFNNVNFDYPVIHFILTNSFTLLAMDKDEAISSIYSKAQEIINKQNNFTGLEAVTSISEKDRYFKQLDLFRIWHFNNKARRTSLKSLEIAMNMSNVMNMPIDHSNKNILLSDIDSILEYNKNDVEATYALYLRSLDKVKLRNDIQNKYGLSCLNLSDTAIGEKLILKLYCDKTGANPYELREMRSKRSEIALKDVLFDYISFNSKEFKGIYNTFKNKVIYETKGAIKQSIVYKGFRYDYGSGGIHGCIKSGIYISDDKYIILDMDVASLYPSIAVLNNLYPEHLGIEFVDVYANMLKERIEAKNAGLLSISDALKLALNSVYGKSNDINSFLYDPKYTMATTINGQLMLTMLAEKLVDNIDNLTMLQVNTDGITIRIPRNMVDNVKTICKDWEKLTKLTLEYVNYDKMVIRDVNNYISLTDKGKIKRKGCFEIDKELHKDNSFKIIPIALEQYFLNDINVEQTIKNHNNIYDFLGRQKFDSRSYGETHSISYTDSVPYNNIQKQQKNTRYYISTDGSVFIKKYIDNSSELIHKGYKVTIFNKFNHKEISDYKINYNYYIKECYKEINQIDSKQLTLEL